MRSAPMPASLFRREAWSDRWHAWRDRMLASPLFQRRAAAFALTRPVARRHARELFDLVAGFVYSQVLLACVQLRVFDMLAEGPQPIDGLAARLALTPEATRRLLDAAVSLRLLEHRGGERYGLGALGAPMVGNDAVAAMVLHHGALYADLSDPVALLRAAPDERCANALARYWAYDDARAPRSHPAVDAYSALMAASQPLVADEILDAYALRGHRCLMDVGGGDGRFLARVAQRIAGIDLMLFDLPAVVERARSRFESTALSTRVRLFGGNFLTEALPRGADVVSLVRVVHDHDDNDAMTILRRVRAALPPGGTLLLAEPMAQTAGAEAMGDAYFGFYLLAMGRGRPRSAEQLTRMLIAAGFDAVRSRPTRMPLQTKLLVARCPRA